MDTNDSLRGDHNIDLERLLKAAETFSAAYTNSLRALQNWSIAINSGGVVAVLSYIVNKSDSGANGDILWTLMAFSIGALCGLLWTLVNYFGCYWKSGEYTKYVREVIRTGEQKTLEFSCKAIICDWLAWIFAGFCLAAIPIGFILGLQAITP